jgi:hypothetical protein
MPRKEKTLDFGHLSVKVHEPTVEQIRNLISREDLNIDAMGFLTGRTELPTDFIELLTDLSQETLKKLTLSELREVLAEAKEMLRPFFEILQLLGEAGGFLGGMRGQEQR